MLKQRLISFLIASILCCALVGCGAKVNIPTAIPTQPAAKYIQVKEEIPPAYVDSSYDLKQVVAQLDGVEYKYSAVYTDPVSRKEKKLTVKSGKMIPKVVADISVTVTAEKDAEKETYQFEVPVSYVYDVLDTLLASDGVAGAADNSVSKELVRENEFLKAEGSTSSLKVNFSNPTETNRGTKLLDLSHYSLMAYYSSRVWDNAAVTLWVYNPNAEDVELKLTSFNSVTSKSLDWSSNANTQVQYAKAGEWTKVSFSLYQMDIYQVLYNSGDSVRMDQLELHGRYDGSGNCTIYIDGVDVVDASVIEGLETGYVEPVLPSGDYTDLFKSCRVYNGDSGAKLEISSYGNSSKDSYRFGSDTQLGYPTFYVDLPGETDISGFDYMKFDVYAEKCYPYVSVAIRYIDENGEVKHQGTTYDFYREQWRTLYVNLDYLSDVDLTRVVGFNFSINVASHMVENAFNCVYFDNLSLYEHLQNEPEQAAPIVEDHDLISGAMLPSNIKIGTSGVCKVSEDETGTGKSNSMLLFWTNNACGYPNVFTTFRFNSEQDWSGMNVLNFDTHQFNGHYWMGFTVFVLDEEGNEKTLFWRHDTVLTHWMTNSAPLTWFTKEDGSSATADDFKRVVGLKIAVDMAVNVTDEVAQIYFDNIFVS